MLKLFSVIDRALRPMWVALRQTPRLAATEMGAPGKNQPARPARFLLVMMVALPSALFAALLVPQVCLVMTPSIDAWAVRKSPGTIKRGDYVMFTLRHPIAGPRAVNVTKHALCMPGDRLTMREVPALQAGAAKNAHYLCNGALLGISLPTAHNGVKLEHMMWSGVIPAGWAYVGSPHPRGFDSRYFGLLPISSLTRMERIL